MRNVISTILFMSILLPHLVFGQNQSSKRLEELDLTELTMKGYDLYTSGRYEEAIPYTQKELEIIEKALGRNHPDVAQTLVILAFLYEETGQWNDAKTLYQRALEILEKALSKNHPDVRKSNMIEILISQASGYYSHGMYREAVPLYKKALKMYEDNPNVIEILFPLADSYDVMGIPEEAEPLFKRALAIDEKYAGTDHPNVIDNLDSLARILSWTGRNEEAEQLLKRVLKINENSFGKDAPDTASSLLSLAVFYSKLGRFEEAEQFFEKARLIEEKYSDQDYNNKVPFLNELAEHYRATGRYKEAELLLKRVFEIIGKPLDQNYPYDANILNNLAELYKATERYKDAVPLYEKALEIRKKTFGKKHPFIAKSLFNMAGLFGTLQEHDRSHRLYTSGMGIKDEEREGAFLLLSERQKINYIKQGEKDVHAFISHTAQYNLQTQNKKTRNFTNIDTLNAWIKRKGVVMEAQGRYIDALIHSDDRNLIIKKFDDLVYTRRAIIKFQFSSPGKINSEEYKKRLKDLEKNKESLEVELNNLSKDFKLENMMGKADVESVAKTLPENSVYIDFAKIRLYDFEKNQWRNFRYLAFVLIPDNPLVVELIDIGETDEINSIIKDYIKETKREFYSREGELNAIAKVMYKSIIGPIEQYIKGKNQLYISPDGNLNLIPFEILVTNESKYLMEDYVINYVSAGRDIIRFNDKTKAKDNVLIMADPDYDLGLEEADKIKKKLEIEKRGVKSSISKDFETLSYERLPGTKEEADKIENVLKKIYKSKLDIKNKQYKEALEEILLKADSPRILHLSTHGYFLKDEDVRLLQQSPTSSEIDKINDFGIKNPMHRSGILLAGANTSLKEGRDGGIVSAEKILGLNLKGTELVVLSACNSGLGDIQSGEGIFGLKRSFLLSGAKTVVMSLWSVPSKETAELMIDFYRLMSGDRSKAEALKQAKLNMKAKNPNPFYWGAFVMVGNPE